MSGFLGKITDILFKGSNAQDNNTPTLYTLSGCIKCRQVKRYMQDNGLPYVEKDANKGAKKEFQKFHLDHFNSFVRGPKGCISFPIHVKDGTMYQGIASILAYLTSGDRLEGYFSVGFQHFEWIDGIHISGGNPEYAEEFLNILRYLKKSDFKLQIDTDGRNSELLKQIQTENLADLMIMNVLGPRSLYSQIGGVDIDLREVEKSLVITAGFPQYKFQTNLQPTKLQTEESENPRYLTTKEVEETALLIKEATSSSKHPYELRAFDPANESSKANKFDAPEAAVLESYLVASRLHQELAEFEAEQQ